ncbi:hypothetical protein TPSD3_03240 [Thioflexithrix psekupsensis]|uniref:Uncharacterized protein n=2 Tax=Thioflexithrix psekupsensis TaxID=1570016 RepID=A0A251XB10_9GAMM|nr:hypothetical protein TPSD3_03240 [Thioflexithrix psekupsensis]
MTEAERQAAIAAFNRDEAIYAQTRQRAEQAKEEAKRARKEAEFWQRHCRNTKENTPEEIKIHCKKITRQKMM